MRRKAVGTIGTLVFVVMQIQEKDVHGNLMKAVNQDNAGIIKKKQHVPGMKTASGKDGVQEIMNYHAGIIQMSQAVQVQDANGKVIVMNKDAGAILEGQNVAVQLIVQRVQHAAGKLAVIVNRLDVGITGKKELVLMQQDVYGTQLGIIVMKKDVGHIMIVKHVDKMQQGIVYGTNNLIIVINRIVGTMILVNNALRTVMELEAVHGTHRVNIVIMKDAG